MEVSPCSVIGHYWHSTGDRQAGKKTAECWWSLWHGRSPEKSYRKRIICIEQAYLKNRTFFVLTDCSSHSNFRPGSTQKTAKYKPHYASCHRSLIDTWGIKKWQRCRDRGCDGTKMCQLETWMNVMVSTARCKSNHTLYSHKTTLWTWQLFFSLGKHYAVYLQKF